MRSNHILPVIILPFIFAAFLFLPSSASAAVGITIAPVKYKFDVDPGQIIENTITVANPNDFVLKVRAEFQDFKVTEDNNIQWLPGDIENPYKMSDWIRIRQDVITLKPKEDQSVPFKVIVPKNATAGGKYAAVFFTGVIEGGGNIGAVPRVGALIILNVKGDLKRTGELLNFSGPRFVNNGPVNFTLSYLNTGTTHYEAKADFTVKNFFWKSGAFSSEVKFVYPNIKRDLKATWNQKALLGIYTVKAKVLDGDGNVYEKSKLVIGFPYLYLLILIVILSVLFYLYRWFKKKFKLVRN
mgnify:CR=1 FL=1